MSGRPVRRLRRWFLATGFLAAIVLGPAVGPSSAVVGDGACEDGASGITVLVDSSARDGGVEIRCVEAEGETAAEALFEDAGFEVSFASQQPGFVCRIDGVPADDPCVRAAPADAFWALYWAGPAEASWAYSTRGLQQLRVPVGGFVAFSWVEEPSRPPVHGAAGDATVPAADDTTAADEDGSVLWPLVAGTVLVVLVVSTVLTARRRAR